MHAHVPTLKSKNTLSNEIESLSTLIERRHKWLNDPINKQRGTYSSVLKDTREMEEKLANLKEEVENGKGI